MPAVKWVGCNPEPDMSKAGRVFSNPMNPSELWANLGYSWPGRQAYPEYEPFLEGAGCDQGQYDGIISAVKDVFAASKVLDKVVVGRMYAVFKVPFLVGMPWSFYMFLLGAGTYDKRSTTYERGITYPKPSGMEQIMPVLVGTLLSIALHVLLYRYVKQTVGELNRNMEAALERAKGSARVHVRHIGPLDLNGIRGGTWVDSGGRACTDIFENISGPPIGYNLVFTCPTAVAPWPPSASAATTMATGGNMQMAEVVAVDNGVSQANFCNSCGHKISEGSRFCAGCGKKIEME
eukprot:TRINITY_DN3724_c0_g1_i3.p1 TRINITY_DN3724_c0_g1~~TRINITY_DN3724_c0_g1_i3.p1  ORF type:complete len:292 (-),score=25.24 TRINITY_DN3724_c0_g1_i3:89-964(-)